MVWRHTRPLDDLHAVLSGFAAGWIRLRPLHPANRYASTPSHYPPHTAAYFPGFLPIEPSEAWKHTGEDNPILTILSLLTVTIGAPYLLLAATSPLLQHWFTLTVPPVRTLQPRFTARPADLPVSD